MNDLVKTIDYNGYHINIYSDDSPQSPREWDNFGHMTCFHSRYNLGDEHDFSTSNDFMEWLNDPEIKGKVTSLWLFLYDHSGITMSWKGNEYPFNDYWDSGRVGIIYVTDDEIREEYKVKRISAKLRQKVVEYLKVEVEVYDYYLRGDVYGYRVTDAIGNEIDSCWGFYGHDNEKSGLFDHAKPAIDCERKRRIKRREGKLKKLIVNGVDLLQRPVILKNYPI